MTTHETAEPTEAAAPSRAERRARERVAADEAALARRKRQVGLGETAREFWRHPSPWMISAALTGAVTARVLVGDWRASDLLAPLVLVALFPVLEWVVHVFVLHWRPRTVAGLTVDTLLARKHREHHTDPRDVPLVFIPWRALVCVLLGYHAIALLAFPRLGQALAFLVSVAVLGLVYEWTHYLIHSDYRPRSAAYKAVWRNHRLHHYRNEHYWFTVTTTATADRLFGTYPEVSTVPASPTAKNLHGTA